MDEKILNLGADATVEKAFVAKATDPTLYPTPYATPDDFSAQYPQPLDTKELIAMCEEITLWQHLPEHQTALNAEYWREMSSLEFNSGSSYIAFADGACPESYTHDGANKTVNIKNIGAKKNLSLREIKHSQAVASANWNGINTLIGAAPAGQGMPGGSDMGTFQRQVVMNLKEKEVRLASTLVMNGWDALLVNGNSSDNSLEFDGIESWATNQSCTMHTNDNSASGTFSATTFDRFLSESCAKPTEVWGHPQAIQEMLMGYVTLGFQGSQVIQYNDNNRIVPGFNFAGMVNTGVGTLKVVADNNFRRNASGSTTFQADLWAIRATHNGEDLAYKITQIPFGLVDLVPGCTVISFQVWAATAFVLKHCCAQGKYTTQFTGRIVSTCTAIG